MANTPYPQSYYAASANTVPARPALQEEVETDVCVIGAGYTGLSSALFLLENGFRVTVLICTSLVMDDLESGNLEGIAT